jgi:hypothetical protein
MIRSIRSVFGPPTGPNLIPLNRASRHRSAFLEKEANFLLLRILLHVVPIFAPKRISCNFRVSMFLTKEYRFSLQSCSEFNFAFF